MPFQSPHPDVDIPDQTLYDFLFADLGDSADRCAVIDGTSGAETTFGTLRAQIDALAGGLTARGLRTGEVVALLCPNIPAFMTVFHGVLRAGGTLTTVNSLYTEREIAEQLIDAGASYVFTLSMFLPQAVPAAEKAGIPAENIVVIDGSDTVAADRTNLRSLLTSGSAPPDLDVDPASHLAVLPYSSGTTGRGKGVMLTHRNLVANLAQIADQFGIDPGDRVLCVLPFFHIYGMNVLMNGALARRAVIVTMPRFDLADFLRVISEHRTSYIFIAPPIAVALAKHPLVDSYDTSAIREVFSGAAPLDAELGHAVERRLNCVVRQGYGMSEMSPASHCIPAGRTDIPLGTVGLTLPNMVCKLVDPATGDEIEPPTEGTSAPGELWCKGPNVMVGYLGNAQATGETLDEDGFLHTGDVATLSAEGYVTIVDRVKELIKHKGYQVAPAELESLLLTHPMIADAAVIGVTDADGDEIPKAFVVCQSGCDLDGDEVIAYVADRVARFKRVRQVQFVDAIPKSTSGKILRRQLRAPVPTG